MYALVLCCGRCRMVFTAVTSYYWYCLAFTNNSILRITNVNTKQSRDYPKFMVVANVFNAAATIFLPLGLVKNLQFL